ncbi:MAG TPA: YdcF family protein, partial [Azospira sp.]|nr:YdcF family protein [Azospira sp.]
GESDNTRDSALKTAALLKEAGITRVLLVSHAWHLPRAAQAFGRAGLEVVMMPTAFHLDLRSPLDYLPQAEGLRRSRIALHEWLGRFWYWLRG